MATVPEATQLAHEHHQAGRLREARIIYERILEKAPNLANVQHMLGTLYIQVNELDKAIPLLEQALATIGARKDIHLNLGEAYRRKGRDEAAIDQFNKALAIDEETAEVYINKALSLISLERFEEASEAGRHATDLQPERAEAWTAYGYALRCDGQIEEALPCFKKAIDLDASSADAAYHYTAAKKFKNDDPMLPGLESALWKRGLIPQHEVSLHFALGKAYDDAGDYGHAFEHFRQANKMQKQFKPYDRYYAQHLTDRFVNFFNETFISERSDWAIDDAKPIFIIGMPRSGTSLVEQILTSHPDVGGAGELKALGDLVNEVPGMFQSSPGLPEVLGQLSTEQARRLGERYLEGLSAHDPDKARVTDKHTINYQLLVWIHVLFPKAKIINIQRNATDTCLSCYFQMFREGQHFSYDLLDAAHYYAQYQRYLRHCRGVGVEMLEVEYEKLVSDQEAETRRMLKWCELKWNKKCLEFHKSKRMVQTASVWQVREPIYNRSVERWRRYECHVAPLQEALKQELAAIEPAPEPAAAGV